MGKKFLSNSKKKRIISLVTSAVMTFGILTYFPTVISYANEVPVSNTFDVNYDGWYNLGDNTSVTAVDGGYNSSRAMLVSGRMSENDGAMAEKGFYLDGGHKYTYSVWVKGTEDTEFTLNLRYLYENGEYGYETIDTETAEKDEWTKLIGTYSAPDGTINLSPIITAEGNADFYFDSFKVTEKVKEYATTEAAGTKDGLKDVYANYFRVGTCVSGNWGNQPLNNSTTQGIILKHFNSITPENELKPDSIINFNGSSGNNVAVSLAGAATIMDFCVQNNIAMRGHTLIWHSQTPKRFFCANYDANGATVSAADMDARMESLINNTFSAINTQYPSLNLIAYDVVNEALRNDYQGYSGGGNWQGFGRDRGFNDNNDGTSGYISVYGDNSFVEKAFTYAKAARDLYLPNTKLFYNDFNEYMGSKHQAMYDLVKDLHGKGILDGVGMQSHVTETFPSQADYISAMDNFLSIDGLEVQITELDIQGSNETTVNGFYRNIFNHAVEVVKAGKNFTALVVWGTTQQSSWITSNNQYVLLFNNQGEANSNYNTVGGTAIVPQAEWGDGDSPRGDTPVVVVPVEPDADGLFFRSTFEEGLDNWATRGDDSIARTGTNSYEGTGSLYVSNRTDTWNGASYSLSPSIFKAGNTYSFGGAVTADVNTTVNLTLQCSIDGEESWFGIGEVDVTAGQWATVQNTAYEIPAGATGLLIYFEVPESADVNFYIDEVFGGVEGASLFDSQPVETGTPEPTVPATPEPTVPATPEPTEPATPEPTEPATPEPTEPATPEPTEPATPEPTEPVTPEPTEPATPEPTEPATPEPTEPATPEPGTPAPTEPATPEPTEPATPAPGTPAPTEPNTPDNPTVIGDLDFDGAAKISDLVALCKHVVGVVGANLTGTALANADCNNDGVVDSTDALTLAKYIVKKIASLPYTD